MGESTHIRFSGTPLWPPDAATKSQFLAGRPLIARRMDAQEWLDKRFSDVTLGMLCGDDADAGRVAIYSTHQLRAPPGFQHVWFPVCDHHRQAQLLPAEVEYISNADAVLVFSDVHDNTHCWSAFHLSNSILSLDADAPPVILLPHSTTRKDQGTNAKSDETDLVDPSSLEMLQTNIDAVVLGQPAGVLLAGEVCSRILNQKCTASNFNRKINERREVIRNFHTLQCEFHETVWEYCRVKLRTGLPAIDEVIGPGQPDTVGDFVLGAKVGHGSFGEVCRLKDLRNPRGASGQVLKMISKKPITSFFGIVSLKREVSVMNMLSSEEHSHINISKLYEVYHTETHILMRLEDGGKLDLYKRLALREQRTPSLPLGVKFVVDIIRQCLAGVCHLHLGPQVVHRDLKPENIIVAEGAENVVVKIADFDCAMVAKPGRTSCSGKVGTFPFMAPEVVLERRYNPFGSDIWSIAIVTVEVICCLNVLKRSLGLHQNKRGNRAAEEEVHMETIRTAFKNSSCVGMLLRKFIQPDMTSLLDDANTLLTGMLNTIQDDRMTAARVRELMAENLFAHSDASTTDPEP